MLRVRTLGRVRFAEANDLQHGLLNADDDYVLVMEHPATYTMGVRTEMSNFLVDPSQLDADVEPADRGGDVTYHAPGQVVAWVIRTVSDEPGAGPAHVHQLEDAVIEVVSGLNEDHRLGRVGRHEGYPGVWAHLDSAPVKISAIGVRTQRDARGRRRTLHGIALNVDVDLAGFSVIVPCGIPDFPVGSLNSLGIDVSSTDVEPLLATAIAAHLGAEATFQSVDRSAARGGTERAGIRRLRRAGVDVDQSLELRERKPEWLRIPATYSSEFQSLRTLTEDLRLVTVCEEAGCPNIFECWSAGTATFMVNGERCTRSCGFCLVDTRHPLPLDPTEPARVAEAVARLDLAHAVITCVARDDLADGGAGAMAETVRAIRERRPGTDVEVLTSDLRGDRESLEVLIDVRPDVLNHNIETVARLQRAVRSAATYPRSLTVLARAHAAGLTTKSGLMVGLGESADEVIETLADLHAVGVSIVTIGQYLRPSASHLPVARWWHPEEFDELAAAGRALGLLHVQSSPLTRSSYHARDALAASVPVALGARR